MLKQILSLVVGLVLQVPIFGQKADGAPSSYQDYIAVEGGGWKIKIDSSSSLDSLIGRLYKKWNFRETGKAYWIGYTDDMYSIAARGDDAIQPLVEVLQGSANLRAKYGAIYSLHLIGINRTIVGRFSEKFVNAKARAALLQFLQDSALQQTIITLLIRDPWASDIPIIMDLLKSSQSDCWPLVSGLTRYNIGDLPFHQKIPQKLQEVTINLKQHDEDGLRFDFDFNAHYQAILDSLKHLKRDEILVEEALFKSNLMGAIGTRFSGPLTIGEIFSFFDFDRYCDLGSRFQYYINGDRIFFCTSETAGKLVLEWWANISADGEARYNRNSR